MSSIMVHLVINCVHLFHIDPRRSYINLVSVHAKGRRICYNIIALCRVNEGGFGL